MIYENTCYSRYSQTVELELELRKHAESYPRFSNNNKKIQGVIKNTC